MKAINRLLFILLFGCFFYGCSPKIVYIPTETIRTVTQVVRDTVITVKLDVIRDSVSVRDTFSVLSNKYSYSVAEWHSGALNHSLGIKDVAIPIRVQYVDISTHDTTTKTIIKPLTKQDQNKLATYDRLKASNKSRGVTIWRLIGLLSLAVLWILRKPLMKLIL